MEFRLLGPLEVVRDGEPLVLRAAKHRSLLALLLLHANELVSYERMFDELWGESPPATARTTLQVYVSGLRKTLGSERIASHARGYELRAGDGEVDVARFERLLSEAREQVQAGAEEEAAERYRQALALWRGPALADVEFASFARNEVERLEELRLQALSERIECELSRGRETELVGELEALVGEHPFHERFRAQLMLALYRQGRQAEALEAYREARKALVEELGIEPGEELRELNRRILEQDPTLAPPAPGALPSGTVTLLCTDVEGSTKLLQELGADYAELLRDEQHLLRQAFTLNGGREVDSQGESFLYAFPRAGAAALAAAEAQRALAEHVWPGGTEVHVRIGIHTGEPALVDGRFVGLDVHRVARICQAGHGGQILLSLQARELVKELPGGIVLRDLGAHRLKDLREPERLYQLSVPGLREDFPPLRSLHATNLPPPSSSFVGRERELAELRALLGDPHVRLLTLTGAGGSGKTRLALELAAQLLPSFPDGAFFVPFASVSEPAFVLPTIAQTLSLREIPGETLAETLARSLEEKGFLLVLDNLEHLLSASPELARLLDGAPRLTLLATSRAPLRISAEHLYEVPTLALPTLGDASTLEELAGSESVALFCERARAVRPQFALTEDNASQVAEICVRLNGLPLALELAAARANVLSPAALLPRLEGGLELLSAGARDRPARQQTMRAAIEWSERLLGEDERTLFRRLSVFAGGFGADAAEAACRLPEEPEFDVFEGISALVEASLLQQEESEGDEPRFFLLEPVREYAGERLEESGEAEAIRERHATYYAGDLQDVAVFWPPLELTREAVDRLRRVDLDLANVRGALDWAHETHSPLELALAVRYQRSDMVFPTEGRLHLERALANPAPQAQAFRARALAAIGGLAVMQGDLARARSYTEESLRLYRESGDQIAGAQLLRNLTILAFRRGDEAEALRLLGEQEALAQRTGRPVDLALALAYRSLVAVRQGDLAAARDLLDKALELTETGGFGECMVRVDLARVAILEGRIGQAIVESETSLQISATYGQDQRLTWGALDLLAAALARADELDTAVRVYAAFRHRLEAREIGRLSGMLGEVRKQTHAPLEEALASPEFADAVADGRRLNVDEATAIALAAAERVLADHELRDAPS